MKKKSFSDNFVPESIKSPENETKFTRYDSKITADKYNTNSDLKLIQDEQNMALGELPQIELIPDDPQAGSP